MPLRDRLAGFRLGSKQAFVESERNQVAGGLGFEPRLTESESAVLPLNYPPRAKDLGPRCYSPLSFGSFGWVAHET